MKDLYKGWPDLCTVDSFFTMSFIEVKYCKLSRLNKIISTRSKTVHVHAHYVYVKKSKGHHNF